MRSSLCTLTVLALSAASLAAPASQPVDREKLRERAMPAIGKALAYLAAQQGRDGGWHGPHDTTDAGVSALVLKAFIQDPRYGPEHPVVKRGIPFLLKHRQSDGGLYASMSSYSNYVTSAALSALAAARSPELADVVKAAQEFLVSNQWSEGKYHSRDEIDTSHPFYGGAGYGEGKRPDLSNTQMMLEALHDSGLPADHPVYRRAMRFIERCQMLDRTNDQPFADGADNGGFIYSPANGGESKAGTIDTPRGPQLRTYGSMTYAGFKSMLYAKVDRDDPRVKAAWDWIRSHYTLDENPNMPGRQSKEGLFYFYHVFARALHAWGEPLVIDARGQAHDWRADLVDKLLSLQAEDGSWINEADRWQEGDPHLVTAYAVLALQAALK